MRLKFWSTIVPLLPIQNNITYHQDTKLCIYYVVWEISNLLIFPSRIGYRSIQYTCYFGRWPEILLSRKKAIRLLGNILQGKTIGREGNQSKLYHPICDDISESSPSLMLNDKLRKLVDEYFPRELYVWFIASLWIYIFLQTSIHRSWQDFLEKHVIPTHFKLWKRKKLLNIKRV